MAKSQAEEPVQLELALPGDKDVVTAVRRLEALQKAVRSASGEMGQYTDKIAEEKDFDKRALRIVRGIFALPDEKFAITWPHVQAYADALGFDDRLAEYAKGKASQQIDIEDHAASAKANGHANGKGSAKPDAAEKAPAPPPERVTRLRPPNRVN